MSGQGGQKGGQGGLPYDDQMRLQQQQQGYMPSFGQGYFSLGRSMRGGMGGSNGPGGFAGGGLNGGGLNGGGLNGVNGGLTGGLNGGQNPFAVGPNNTFLTNTLPQDPNQNPFARGPNNSLFGMNLPGQNPQAAQGSTYGGMSAPNTDPNSPEYLAYYNSLAPSTRAFLAAPGSGNAWNIYNQQQASLADPNAAHF